MKKLLTASAAFLLMATLPIYGQTPTPSTPPLGQLDPEKEKLIRQVLARTQEAEMAQVRIFQAIAGMKQAMPRVPEKYWTQYRQLVSVDELRNRLVAVYDKHYTSDDLTELLKFYDSPLGKKMSGAAVPILKDSMEVAQELSKRASQSVTSDIQAEQLLERPTALGSLGGLPPPGAGYSAASPTPTPTPTPTAP